MSNTLPRLGAAAQASIRLGSGLPIVSAYVSGRKEGRFLSAATINMADSLHTVAEVTVHYPIQSATYHTLLKSKSPQLLSNKTMWPARAPVHLVYGRTFSNTNNFYGYMTSRKILPVSGPVRSVVDVPVSYTLTGISYNMQSQVSKVWKNVTASSIASSIATKYLLKAIITPHPRVWSYRAQDAISDFLFLSELATEIGYRFWVDPSGVLYFVNPYTTFANGIQSTNIPTFDKSDTGARHNSLQSFITDDGELTPTGGIVATRKVAAINPSTGAEILAKDEFLQYTAFGTSTTPLIQQYRKDLTADSHADALSLAQADMLANRHWVTAEAVVDGSQQLVPGSLINVSGVTVPTEESGLWMIKSAVHSFRLHPTGAQNLYNCDLCVGRDQKYTVAWQAPANWTQVLTKPNMVNVNGEWRAYFVGPSS